MIPIPVGFFSDGGAGVVTDPNFSSVALLLHCEGANGGTTFTDSSSYARTATLAVGTVTTSTSGPAIGGASLLFSSGSNRITFPQATSLDIGASDFTIEFRVKFITSLPTPAAPATIVSKFIGNGSSQRAYRITMDNNAGGSINFRYTTSNAESNIGFAMGGISLNTWYAMAISKSSGTTRGFKDGVSLTPSGSGPGTLDTISAVTSIGALLFNGSTVEGLVGNLDEVRVTIGVGRYTANYAVSPSAYPDA